MSTTTTITFTAAGSNGGGTLKLERDGHRREIGISGQWATDNMLNDTVAAVAMQEFLGSGTTSGTITVTAA